MSDRYLDSLKRNGHTGSYIPSGRQLHRTPPLTCVKRHLDFCNEEENNETMEAATRDQGDNNQNRTFNSSNPVTKTEPDDPASMLKGMKGYRLTPGDLEFIEKMKEEKLIKKLQGDLEEGQRLLKNEMMAAELVFASRENAQAELKRHPSGEELTDWAKMVLEMTRPLADLADLDAKTLLAMVMEDSIQKVMDEKKIELDRIKKIVANKRKEEAKGREQLEKQIASEQLKIQGLMSQLSNLKSELAQEEEAYKALEMQMNTQETPENKVEAERVDTSEEQATKSRVKHRGNERKKDVRSTEKLQDVTKQSKSTRSKHTGSESSVKDIHENKNTSETLRTKQESGAAAEKPTKSVRAARGPQKKVEEKESNPPESEQIVRGRRKPLGAAQTAASQPKNQSKVKTGEAPSSRSRQKAAGAADDGGEEAQNAGLRRSKRIASRR